MVIFAVAFVAIVAMLALLVDGANAYVVRRELQNASDAAALAAANVIQAETAGTCSASGAPGGAPRLQVINAAKASVEANLPGFPPESVVVTCPAAWENYGVRVELETTAPRFFSVIWSRDDLAVSTGASAVNGYFTERNYSVVTLNPMDMTHPSSRNGCPSVLFSGGPTVTMDSAMHLNSGCLAPEGGALGTNGNAASLTMGAGAPIRIVGDYVPGTLTINPPPMTGAPPITDPYKDLPSQLDPLANPPNVFPRFTSNCNGCVEVLTPGIYNGGIRLGGQARAVMQPGIYVMAGGGLELGAQTHLYSVNDGVETTSPETWNQDCTTSGGCGVLIYNTTGTGAYSAMSPVTVGAGATLKVRSKAEYVGVLIWQNKFPEPTAAYAQPVVTLSGGGSVDMTGTIYAPSARIFMRGGAGGTSGGSTELALRFISWDLQFNGNTSFHFVYVADEFSTPMDYGLVE